MKVIDLQLYRAQRIITTLEKRIGQLATTSSEVGAVREMKTCFIQWLKLNAR
jgi:hypothetical protein